MFKRYVLHPIYRCSKPFIIYVMMTDQWLPSDAGKQSRGERSSSLIDYWKEALAAPNKKIFDDELSKIQTQVEV